jgi:UDP:flavonoid glycosyltransferase YjiC (YdhE family)
LIDIHGGAPFVWPQGADKTAPRIFVYLQANTPGTRNLLHALANLGWPAVVCCPGFTREPDLLRLSKEKSSLVLHEHLLDIHQARSQADFGVGNGSAGFISAFLLGGLPLLLVPYDSEKNLNAQRLATLGAGLVVLPIEGAASCISALQNMRNNQAIRRAALAFAARYAAHSTAEITATFARQCREIAL